MEYSIRFTFLGKSKQLDYLSTGPSFIYCILHLQMENPYFYLRFGRGFLPVGIN